MKYIYFSNCTDDPDYEFISHAAGEDSDSERIEFPIQRIVSIHKYCCLCGANNQLKIVPFETRKQVYARRRIFIPSGNGCYRTHLIKNKFYEDELSLLKIVSNFSLIDLYDFKNLLNDFAKDSEFSLLDKIGNFSYPEHDLQILTGFIARQSSRIDHDL